MNKMSLILHNESLQPILCPSGVQRSFEMPLPALLQVDVLSFQIEKALKTEPVQLTHRLKQALNSLSKKKEKKKRKTHEMEMSLAKKSV